MDWTALLRFLRGPFFAASLLIFIGGMAYRLVRTVLLGWSRDRVESRGSKITGVVKSYLKGFLVLPFIPWVKRTFVKNTLTYVAGGLFHLGAVRGHLFRDAAHARLEEPDRLRLADAAAADRRLAGRGRHPVAHRPAHQPAHPPGPEAHHQDARLAELGPGLPALRDGLRDDPPPVPPLRGPVQPAHAHRGRRCSSGSRSAGSPTSCSTSSRGRSRGPRPASGRSTLDGRRAP